MRAAVPAETRPVTRPVGSAVTSVALLVLVLAPALVIITGAEALSPGAVSTQSRGHVARSAAGYGTAATHHAAGDFPAPHGEVRTISPADDEGLLLLRKAASAGRTVPYEGVQIISWWSPDGSTTVAVDVAHQPRRGTLLQALGAGNTPGGEAFVPGGRGAQPGDVLGITEDTFDLLSANYQVVPAGTGSSCDRPATIVEALRADGTLAAKFWLDDVTRITLRRELFDDQSRMINESTFIDLKFGDRAAAASVQAQPDLASATSARPWNILTAADLRRLRARGWPLPAELPRGLVLFDARQAVTASGQVFQLGYSDGLSGMSLFVQRGGLSPELAGWREVEIGGRTVFARDPIGQGITWSSRDHVLTLIADAPAATIGAAVKALPHDAQRGFWSRLGYGFRRVVSWINPLG